MNFDEERYARDVLEPARLAGGQPPDDLLVRYGLSLPLSAAQVDERLPAVLGCWRRARRELRYRRLVARLEADHARLAPVLEKARTGDLEPFLAVLDERRCVSRERLDRFRAEVADLAAPVGRITANLAAALAATHAVQPDEAGLVLAEAGVEVATPDVLPAEPLVAGYPRYRDALRTLGCRHTADFLLGDQRGGAPRTGPYAVFDTVRVADAPGREVDASTVEAADRTWAARPHDGSRTLASTVLVTLARLLDSRGPAGVGEQVRYELAEALRARHRLGVSAGALVGYAADGLGLTDPDARRIAFAVRAEAAGATAAEGVPAGAASAMDDGGGGRHAADLVPLVPSQRTSPAEVPAETPARHLLRYRGGTGSPLQPHPATDPEPRPALEPAPHPVPDPPEPHPVPDPEPSPVAATESAGAAEPPADTATAPFDTAAEPPPWTVTAPVSGVPAPRVEQDVTTDSLPPAAHAPLPVPADITARRSGDEVVVRWQWPPEVSAVNVRWRLGDQPWRETVASRGGYRAQGGCWLPVAAVSPDADVPSRAPLRIEVTPVASREGRLVSGPAVTVRVPGQDEAWYEVTRTGPPWRRDLVVTFRADRPLRLRGVDVVLRRGSVMPLQVSDGELLRHLDGVELAPGRPVRLRLPAPHGAYWLRCFSAPDEPVELRDPPVTQLRGR